MLLPQIEITQKECNQLIIKDITPDYSPDYPGGYGGPNIEAENIVWTEVTLQFSKDEGYNIGRDYNATKMPWELFAFEIPTGAMSATSGCLSCGDKKVIISDNGFLSTYPTGCIDVKYEVFSFDADEDNKRKHEGTKIIRIISSCSQEKKLIELADKLTLPNIQGGYDIAITRDDHREMMNHVTMAKFKLDLLTPEAAADCSCIAASLKQIDSYIEQALRLWP